MMRKMRTKTRFPLACLVVAASTFALAATSSADIETDETSEPAAQVSEEQEEQVQSAVAKQVAERRRAMLDEANSALDETHAALEALENGKNDEALAALARATGQLELLVARDPSLGLAPIDVGIMTHDLYATPEAIREARDRAAALLEDGRLQEARRLIGGLASEVTLTTTNLPLASYPSAIKAISPLIDEGEIDQAQAALRAALNTLVVTKQVVALPPLRAEAMLREAQGLLNHEGSEAQEEAPRVDTEEIESLVAGARLQIEMAELLGYGAEEDYEPLRSQLAELRKSVRGDDEAEAEGLVATLRKSLRGLQESIFN